MNVFLRFVCQISVLVVPTLVCNVTWVGWIGQSVLACVISIFANCLLAICLLCNFVVIRVS